MTQDPVDDFAANIRRERTARGLSQEKLADLAELDRTYVGSVERSERNITLRSAQRIAAALDLELWKLLMPENEERI